MGKRRKRWLVASKRNSPIRLMTFKARRSDSPSYSHPACYAAVRGDCSHELSEEHFMSFALLMGLVKDPQGIHVSGSRWGQDGSWIQPERIVSPVLCSNHNRQLEPLDGFAANFERECSRIHAAARADQVVTTVTRYHGNNLERWMLKVLCGLVASENARRASGEILTTAVPEHWIKVLYGDADLSARAGLYVSGEVGSKVPFADRFTVAPLTSEAGLVAGLVVELRSFAATLMIESFSGTPAGALQRTSIRHPRFLSWTNGRRAWRIDFVWNDSYGPGIEMAYSFDDSDTAA